MNPLSFILASLAMTTTVVTFAFAQQQQVFSLLDNKDIIMHAYTGLGDKVTFAGRFNRNGEIKQRLPATTQIETVQIVYGQELTMCRFRAGEGNQVSHTFGPNVKPLKLRVPQAHSLECVLLPDLRVGGSGSGGGDGGGIGDILPESNQKTTFLKE